MLEDLEAADEIGRQVDRLLRAGGWSIGVGAGPVQTPLPASTRAATGPAFLSARRAVEAATRPP